MLDPEMKAKIPPCITLSFQLADYTLTRITKFMHSD